MSPHATAPVRSSGPTGRLADVLRRCAAGGDPHCLADLKASCGHQVGVLLERALGDPEMATFALPAVLADLRDRAGEFDPAGQAAEEWVLEVARGRIRDLVRAAARHDPPQTTGNEAGREPRAPPPRRWRRWQRMRQVGRATTLLLALLAFVVLVGLL